VNADPIAPASWQITIAAMSRVRLILLDLVFMSHPLVTVTFHQLNSSVEFTARMKKGCVKDIKSLCLCPSRLMFR
jgi:hypothetical protein